MSKVFTAAGAEMLQRKFDEMCKQFAKENDVVYEKNHLTYGEQLRFSAVFSIAENKDEAWESMVNYFDTRGAHLYFGQILTDEGKTYKVTGKLNPSRKSKFVIELLRKDNQKLTYGTIDWVLSLILSNK